MKKCKKKQICNVCEGAFKMKRGCLLEKRCPSCRFLGIRKNHRSNFSFEKDFVTSQILGDYLYYQECGFAKNVNIETNIIREEAFIQFYQVLEEVLSDREFYIIRLRSEEVTLESISKEVGVNRERVRQIEFSAIKKLKHPSVGNRIIKALSDDSCCSIGQVLCNILD